ncbi:MAG: DNA replication/repair protein RecF [Clostridia bacterium]|nr:DNA replication/repair protein RecF [Clostridia bacterium]
MKATSISFENYRNIREATVEFSPGVNVLWGANAQGKSNILEGMYYFARGKSFRGVPDKLLVRTGCDFGTASLTCRGEGDVYDTHLSVTFPTRGKKRITRGGAPLSGVKELVGSFRAVLFCPEHLSLVTGAPAERRSFLDIALAQLYPDYVSALSVYTHALTERNALLKQAAEGMRVEDNQWAVYARQLARSGAAIVARRSAYTDRLNALVGECFHDMTGGREIPRLSYICAAGSDAPADLAHRSESAVADRFYAVLTERLMKEISAGTTLYGIHRDDVAVDLNEQSAKLYASQGQRRSLALAMKLAEGAIAHSVGGEEPVYLLDDVFSELDGERREYLLSALGQRQVIITSCEGESIFESIADVALFAVEAGQVQRKR